MLAIMAQIDEAAQEDPRCDDCGGPVSDDGACADPRCPSNDLFRPRTAAGPVPAAVTLN